MYKRAYSQVVGAGGTATIPKCTHALRAVIPGLTRNPGLAVYRPPPPPQGSSFPVTGPDSVASVAERLSRQ
jgi:hypothetical protein